jgi:hypothetical protein
MGSVTLASTGEERKNSDLLELQPNQIKIKLGCSTQLISELEQ